MREVLLHHKGSFIFAIVTMLLGFGYGLWLFGDVPQAVGVVFIILVLTGLELSVSMDNALINGKLLKDMSEIWRRRFLTWGMLIAVFGMRVFFPLLIVAIIADINIIQAVTIAIKDPVEYSKLLSSSHIMIAGFGGAFLFLVAFKYFFDAEKDIHWVKLIESKLTKFGELESFGIILTLILLLCMYILLGKDGNQFLISGLIGIVSHECIKMLGDLTGSNNVSTTVVKNGLMGFLYIEMIDISFSMDSVVAALAVSNDIFIIALGLGTGAMFVRSMTIHLVESGTLAEYKYLEHGAFWSILVLATCMFIGTIIHIPELVVGLLSIITILAALAHSILVKNKE